ncbi:MAG: GNAT family N-acetyltransferase [Acidimicrobiales bacterium]
MSYLRPATPDDAEAIERVRTAGWRTAYRGMVSDAFLDSMNSDVERRRRRVLELGRAQGAVELVAVDGDQLVGWTSGGPTRDTDTPPPAEIYALYVHPDAWRQGLGRRLLEQAVEQLRQHGNQEVTLWVLGDNHPARRFYEAMGFEADGATNILDLGGAVQEVRYRRALEA